MGKFKTSSNWQFFIKNSSGGLCKICQRQVNCKGNTTNLSNHLKRHHKSVLEKSEDTKDSELIDDPDASLSVST
ncbi:hypothetical protein ALC57_00279 [Trachymyrmex cornetzi]|uniref:BED-type domain-containing protein n=1 Tax=Trachymyrmex cornetzi TaxID=471704 RepID=A0A151JSE4_9HYME|nr:hypothetical protein ALC57_00279 [Trachymyrmex cornetzi]